MEPSAPSYLDRAADAQLLKVLLAGEYVCLLDSRQKGKSSLVARTIVKLKEHGILTIKLDLQRVGSNVTPERWYAGLMLGIGQELGIADELIAYWDSRQSVGPLARWLGAISEVVLAKTEGRIVIFVDEVDYVRALDFSTDEFFAGIRDCFNRRSEQSGFERLTFCLVGVATPGQLIRNPDITPFNIGTKIELTDFTLDETKPYCSILERGGRNGESLMKRIHHWVNGHPYLTQLLCSHIAETPAITSPHDVDRLVKELFFTPEARHSEPNFAAVEQRILDPDVPGMSPEERKTQVLELYGRLLRGKGVEASEENPVVASLQLAGVGHQVHGSLHVRNLVYKTVFDEGWRRQSLPNAELRRQRGAARVAILRTAAVAGIVVLAISSAAVGILKISKEREKALVTLGQRTNDLSRVSSDRKVALTDLEKRNEELKRISSEREDALSSLGKSNENLKVTSNERKKAVISLEKQSSQLKQRNEELSQVSKEREQALVALGSRTNELRARNYVGVMSSIEMAMRDERYMRIAELIKQTKDSPMRNWEWGHTALLVNSHEAEFLLPESSGLERQPDRSVSVITPDSIYDFTPKGIKFRRKLAGPPVAIGVGKGGWRVGKNLVTGALVLRDTVTDQVLWSYTAGGRILDFDPQRRVCLLATPFKDPPVGLELLLVDGNKQKTTFEGVPGVTWIARFMKDGTILSFHFNGEVIRWDGSGRKLSTQHIPNFVSYGSCRLLQSRDGSLVCFYDNQYRLLEVRRSTDLSVVATMSGGPILASSCSFSADASKLIVGGQDGTVRVFKADTGELLRRFVGHLSSVSQALFPWDGDNRLVSLDADRHLRVWSFNSQPAVEVYKEHKDQVLSAALINDNTTLISQTHYGLVDKAIVCRDLRTGKTSSRRGDYEDMIHTDSKIFLALANGNVERLSAEGLKQEKTAQIFKQWMMFWGVYGNGTRLLVGDGYQRGESVSREHAIVDTEGMTVISRFTLDWPKGSNMSPNYSFDREEKTLLVAAKIHGKQPETFGGLAFLISCADGKILKKIELDTPFDASHLTPDGKQMILGQIEDGSTKPIIFDLASLKVVGSLPPVKSIVRGFEFDPSGKTLAGLVRDGPAYLWDFKRRCLVATLSPGTGIEGFSFSPDGSRVVTSGPNRTNLVWDTRTGEELLTLRYKPLRENDQIGGLPGDKPVFSDDGRKVIMGCTDGAVRIFNSLPWKDQPKAARK